MANSSRIIWNFTSTYAKNGVPVPTQLRMIRKLLGISQAAMARKLGVHGADLYILEGSKRKVGFKKVQDYCEALGLSMVLVPKGMLGKLMENVTIPVGDR